MKAGYAWDGRDTRTDDPVPPASSLALVPRAETDATRDQDVVGGIARFSLGSSEQRIDLDCAGGIVRFDFGS